jgi:hypothetical protein
MECPHPTTAYKCPHPLDRHAKWTWHDGNPHYDCFDCQCCVTVDEKPHAEDQK